MYTDLRIGAGVVESLMRKLRCVAELFLWLAHI
jgi:hypothetical protein